LSIRKKIFNYFRFLIFEEYINDENEKNEFKALSLDEAYDKYFTKVPEDE
jgi:hypothetical protein